MLVQGCAGTVVKWVEEIAVQAERRWAETHRPCMEEVLPLLFEVENVVEQSVDIVVGGSSGRTEWVDATSEDVDKASPSFEESAELEKTLMISEQCQATLAYR